MPDPELENQIAGQVKKLDSEQQRQVLAFVSRLAGTKPPSVPGQALHKFAGAIDPGDLEIMARVIEEECERVNLNEW